MMWLPVDNQTHLESQFFHQLRFDEPVVRPHRDGVPVHTLIIHAKTDGTADRDPKSLTLAECQELLEKAPLRRKRGGKKKTAAKKKTKTAAKKKAATKKKKTKKKAKKKAVRKTPAEKEAGAAAERPEPQATD